MERAPGFTNAEPGTNTGVNILGVVGCGAGVVPVPAGVLLPVAGSVAGEDDKPVAGDDDELADAKTPRQAERKLNG